MQKDDVELIGPPLAEFQRSLFGSRYTQPIFVRLQLTEASESHFAVAITSVSAAYSRVELQEDLGAVGCSDPDPTYHMTGWLLNVSGRSIPEVIPVQLQVWRGGGGHDEDENDPERERATHVLIRRTETDVPIDQPRGPQ